MPLSPPPAAPAPPARRGQGWRRLLAATAWSLLLAPTLTAAPAAAVPRLTSLTIATYNVENYNATNRLTEAGYRTDYPKPEAAKRALLATLQALQADVLVLQEMGPLPYLEELQRDLRQVGLDYPHRILVAADDASRHVAALARVPWQRAVAHTDLDFKYQGGRERLKRGLLEIELLTPQGPLFVWAVHLKSRYTDRPDDPASTIRRSAEAVAIRDLLLRRHGDPQRACFLLLGDFNDLRPNRPLRACLARGQTTILTMLPAADSRGETWTRFQSKDDTYERVDFILCSPGLLPRVRDRRGFICDAPATRSASDHRPVGLTLDFR